MVDKTKVACFSGHRKLPADCTELKKTLKEEIIKLIEKGVVYFGAGGALGFDMLAEEMILELKQTYPHIQLILVLPCTTLEQTHKWNDEQKKRYYDIFDKADYQSFASSHYTPYCMFKRNRQLVDNSAYLISYLRKNHGGTYYTVNYAKEKGLDIILL